MWLKPIQFGSFKGSQSLCNHKPGFPACLYHVFSASWGSALFSLWSYFLDSTIGVFHGRVVRSYDIQNISWRTVSPFCPQVPTTLPHLDSLPINWLCDDYLSDELKYQCNSKSTLTCFHSTRIHCPLVSFASFTKINVKLKKIFKRLCLFP